MKNETANPGYSDTTLTATEPPSFPPPSALRKIFIGQDGLRAGWSLLIFIALLAAIGYGLNVIAHRLYPSAPKTDKAISEAMGTPRFLLVGESTQLLVVLLVTWICRRSSAAPTPSTASATAACSRTFSLA